MEDWVLEEGEKRKMRVEETREKAGKRGRIGKWRERYEEE